MTPSDSVTPSDYELHDYQAIATILETLSLEVMRSEIGDGWQGFVEDNAPFEPATSPAPAVFAQWALEYSSVAINLDPESPPFRDGVVTFFLRLQPGARRGLLLLAARKIREAFRNASPPLQFQPATTLNRKGIEDGYWTEQLDIPFHAAGD